MIINQQTIKDDVVNNRLILLCERAFVEKGTLKLFVPLLQEEVNDHIVYSNHAFRREESTLDEWFVETVPSFDIIFKFNPSTLIYEE